MSIYLSDERVIVRKMIHYLLILLCIISEAMSRRTTNYCDMFCGRENHTLCKGNFICLPAENCYPVMPDYSFRMSMVHYHNFLRNQVAIGNESRGGNSASSNMMTISYDMALEAIAFCWVGQLVYDYDKCRITTRFNSVGQNIYKAATSILKGFDFEDIVRAWYEQVNNTDTDLIDNFTSNRPTYRRYRHFTQLVNAKTAFIGCAYAMDLIYRNQMVVCNYGPSGNLENQAIYIRGPPTDNCPIGYYANEKYQGLCGEVQIPLEAYRLGMINLKGAVLLPSIILVLFFHIIVLVV